MKFCNERDLLVMSMLRRDARMKLTDMSRKTRIPVSTLFDLISKFRERRLVRKFTALLDFERLGYHRVVLVLSCGKGQREKLRKVLEAHPNLNSLFRINNGWAFLAEMVFPGVSEAELFLDELDEKVNIVKRNIFYVLKDYKREGFLAKGFLGGVSR